MSQYVKLKYHPEIKDCTEWTTPFGVTECSYPEIYETPIRAAGDTIVNTMVYDGLSCLGAVYGQNMLAAREPLYKLISGSITAEDLQKTNMNRDEYYSQLFSSFYSRFSSFQNEVDLEYFYGNKAVPLLQRVVSPILRRVHTKMNAVCARVEAMPTGKVLLVSNLRVYIAFRRLIDESQFKEEDGFRIIKNV